MFKYEHTRGSLKLGGDYSFKVCVGGGGGGGVLQGWVSPLLPL